MSRGVPLTHFVFLLFFDTLDIRQRSLKRGDYVNPRDIRRFIIEKINQQETKTRQLPPTEVGGLSLI